MFILLPIRTECEVRRTPLANYVLLAVNGIVFLLLDEHLLGESAKTLRDQSLGFPSTDPAFYQFLTYQFVHASPLHLLGNMLFLWVFGNSVNAKMRDLPYFLFYLAGGVFAAWGYALVNPERFYLIGASGAIASVTAAYLVLFPRSRVTILAWFFFIYTFEVPAMLLIGLKIIVWDNIASPRMGISDGGNVAHQAHLAGYLFGFVAALFMLAVRAVQRDQFDLLALWKRWRQRRQFAAAMADPAAAARARFGTAGRPAPDAASRAAEEKQIDALADLRVRIGEAVDRRDLTVAADDYEKLLAMDPRQCLSEMQQLDVARECYVNRRSALAAAAFERFLDCYPQSRELENVRLLLGIIYARDLRQYEPADRHLTRTLETVRDESRRAQCTQWLREVRAALGKPAPEA